MIYVCTVHHETDRWIPLQARSLARWLPASAVFAVSDYPAAHFAERVPTARADQGFVRRGREDSNHAWRLDALLRDVLQEAKPDDVLVTLDSDALLVADPSPLFERLAAVPMLAVCRDRESTERWKRYQPHPCFSAVLAGRWQAWGASWAPGPWLHANGTTETAVGGRLAPLCGDDWLRLRRVNGQNPHPMLFGLYGATAPLVYHHGAGSRVPLFIRDKQAVPKEGWPQRIAENQALSDAWYARACADEDFWRALG